MRSLIISVLSMGVEDGNLTHIHAPAHLLTLAITSISSHHAASASSKLTTHNSLGQGYGLLWPKEQVTQQVAGLVTAERELWLQADPYEVLYKGENLNITFVHI